MWFLRIWEFFSGAAGAWLVGLAARNLVKGWRSRGWSQTLGTLVRSFVLVDKSDDGEGYTPQVEYEYNVAGAKYVGKRLRYGQIGNASRKKAERVIERYRAGAQVVVWFNPEKP